MEKLAFIVLFIFNSFFQLISQSDCAYSPVDFQDTDIIWRHLIVDSTLTGVVDSGFHLNTYDGHNHLSIEFNKSFVHGGFLYSISESHLDNDYSGVLAEKINLENGKLEWKIKHDRRFNIYREKVLDVRVEQNQFILRGIREDIDDRDTMDNRAFIGKKEGKTFERIYDLESGDLISFYTPSQDDSLAVNVSFIPNLYYNYFDENLENYLDARNLVEDKGFYLIKRVINREGHRIGSLDTLVTGRFSDRLHSEAIDPVGPRFRKLQNGQFLYIEQYSPSREYEHSFEAFLTNYDEDFNKVAEVDLKSFGIDTFHSVIINRVTDDYILLEGLYGQVPFWQSDSPAFCLVLDHSFNLITKFDCIDPVGRDFFLNNYNLAWEHDFDGTFKMIFTVKTDDISSLILGENKDNGFIYSVKKLDLIEENRNIGPAQVIIIENGDYLFNLRIICRIPGIPYKEYREWVRIPKGEIITKIENHANTKGIELYPNPSSEKLSLKSDEALIGNVMVFDVLGQLVFSNKNINSHSYTIDISNLSFGRYYVRVNESSGSSFILPFVKI